MPQPGAGPPGQGPPQPQPSNAPTPQPGHAPPPAPGPQQYGAPAPGGYGQQLPGQPWYQPQPERAQYPGVAQDPQSGQFRGSPQLGSQYGAPPGVPQFGAASPGYGGPAAEKPLSSAVTVISWVSVGLCVLIVVAANLPWVTLGALNVAGTDDGRDGWITLGIAVIVGIVAAVSALIRKPSGIHLAAGILAVIGGLLVAGIGMIDIADVNEKGFGVGSGLTLTLILGILLLVAGIAGIVKRR